MTNYIIPALPIATDLYTKKVLKKGIAANKALAKLNGVSETIPNEQIILNTLSLQEAKVFLS
ncbi:cell filamentation protein Fic [Myroides sp. NP-2]|nr:cell filamentation protein Fic [Myroides sp. NP-2]